MSRCATAAVLMSWKRPACQGDVLEVGCVAEIPGEQSGEHGQVAASGQWNKHPPAVELLRPGAVLQPHDVRRVHRLADARILPRLPCERLRGAWRPRAVANHGRQPEIRRVAPLGVVNDRGGDVEPRAVGSGKRGPALTNGLIHPLPTAPLVNKGRGPWTKRGYVRPALPGGQDCTQIGGHCCAPADTNSPIPDHEDRTSDC